MSESHFIKEETLSRASGVFALNRRLFGSLSLFLKFLPLSILTILLSSAAPSVFRWYSGELLSGRAFAGPLRFTLSGLVAMALLAVLLRISAWACFEISGMWASQSIHHRMVRALSRTRTTYFDENPSGRLINRLVLDFDEVRSTAIIFVGDVLNATVEILSIAVVACLASPWAGLLILPLLAIFAYVQSQRAAMLDHARALSAIATGQVLGRKTDLIEGREIFGLYGRADELLRRMARSFGEYVSASGLGLMIETWASFWIRISAVSFSFCVLLVTIYALRYHRVDAAIAGVIISALFSVTGSLGWLDFATSLVSRSAPHVRRVFEIVDLPGEEEQESARAARAPAEPSGDRGGDIELRAFTMSYRADTPRILDRVDLVIPWGRKTALIGRTGSGKTSVVQSLLRMVYVHSGDITIGGRSIFDVDLRELRTMYGVVPQSPYLFAGTVGSNLDRSGRIARPKLESALEAVGLELSLDQEIAEGGQNLSVGERQLVCLARVIAADRRIILMDEPTSGLDPLTDARVTRVFNTVFKDRTVLTIAHRRESLGGYDRIVEMSAGKVVSVTDRDH